MLKKKGFTLIELMVVIVIVSTLASVSVPMMRGPILRARSTEAVAALGVIRTQMRVVFSQYGNYEANGTILDGAIVGNVPGFSGVDLDGTYFDGNDYYLKFTPEGFDVICTGNTPPHNAPKAADVKGIAVTIDANGKIDGTYNGKKLF